MLIGRKKEIKLLQRSFESKESEFITVYGRRRVGKTFHIRQFFQKKCEKLCDTGFISQHIPWGKSQGEFYKILDEFCLFYHYWLKRKGKQSFSENHWIYLSQKPEYYAWAGYAFEACVYKHIDILIQKLHLLSASTYASWRYIPKNNHELGCQIDIVIDRSDNAITLCEVKNTKEAFLMDKKYYEQ